MNHESICENLNIPQIYGYFVRNQVKYFARNLMLYHNLCDNNVFVLATTCSKHTSASNSLDLHPFQYLKCIFCQQLLDFTFTFFRLAWVFNWSSIPFDDICYSNTLCLCKFLQDWVSVWGCFPIDIRFKIIANNISSTWAIISKRY